MCFWEFRMICRIGCGWFCRIVVKSFRIIFMLLKEQRTLLKRLVESWVTREGPTEAWGHAFLQGLREITGHRDWTESWVDAPPLGLDIYGVKEFMFPEYIGFSGRYVRISLEMRGTPSSAEVA